MSVGNVKSLTFNHDQSSFACCIGNKVRIYDVKPHPLSGRFDFDGLMKFKLLNPPRYLAIISDGKNTEFCQNTVINYYNTALEKFKGEIVKSVEMRRDLIIVVTVDSISIFMFPSVRRIFFLETCLNPMGLCVITAEPPLEEFKSVIAFPGDKIGIIYFMEITYSNSVSKISDEQSVLPYQGEVSCLAINRSGTLIACAISNGTVIRIWNTLFKTIVVDLRCGLDTETLYCMSMNFSSDSELLCCSSDKGIIQIFEVLESGSFPIILNFSISPLRRALATFKVPSEAGCICTFSTQNTVVAICLDDAVIEFKFSMDGSTRMTSLRQILL